MAIKEQQLATEEGEPIPGTVPEDVGLSSEVPEILEIPDQLNNKLFARIAKTAGRVAVATILVVGAGIGAGVAGVTLTETSVHVGPHVAKMRATFDGYVTINSEPDDTDKQNSLFPAAPDCGTDQNDSSAAAPVDWMGNMGAELTFHDLPVCITRDGIIPANLSPKEVASYMNLFGNYSGDIRKAEDALRHKFYLYAGLGSVGVLCMGLAARRLGRIKNAEDVSLLSAGSRYMAPAMAISLMGMGIFPVVHDSITSPKGSTMDMIYPGMPANLRASGGLLDFERQFKSESDSVQEDIKSAYAKSFKFYPDAHTNKIVVEEGSKCSNLGARNTNTLAKLVDARFVLSVGDDGVGGDTMIDGFCVSGLASTIDARFLKVLGNHDPHLAAEQAKKLGLTLLNGHVEEIGGTRIVGISDPAPDRGHGRGAPSNAAEQRKITAQTFADEICGKDVDIAVTNQPSVGLEVLHRGCSALVISGGIQHSYEEVEASNGLRVGHILTGSSGGAVYSNRTNLAALTTTSGVSLENTIITTADNASENTGKPLYSQTETIIPDKHRVSYSYPVLTEFGRSPEGTKILTGIR